jgi:hypothetical protein
MNEQEFELFSGLFQRNVQSGKKIITLKREVYQTQKHMSKKDVCRT